jgi:hypothetical protein
MKKAVILFFFVVIVGGLNIKAQEKKSVVIGTKTDRPNALLFLNPANHDQGFLPPQLTTAQRLAITPKSPDDDGLIVFDIVEQEFYSYRNNVWVKGLATALVNTPITLSFNSSNNLLTVSPSESSVDLNSLKEIPSTAGHGGKYLTTDGTQLQWILPPPKTTYMSIDPGDFMALKADLGSGGHNTAVFQSDNTFITANDLTASKQVMASVHIPHGAILQELRISYQDNEPARNLQVKMFRKKIEGGNEEMFTWTSSGSDVAIKNQVVSSFNNMQKIDLSSYSYRIVVYFDMSGLVDLPGNAPQRVYGMRLTYLQ